MKKEYKNHYKYSNDSRYEKVYEQMQLLGIQDVTTDRQHKNGTTVWKLPIKNYWPGNKENATCIEVASFSTGYVRNQNSGYSNYQLNKRKFDDEYFQDYEWKTIDGEYQQVKIPGQYRKWSRKTCVMIPIEIDRLEYLISYCLKNYYIKRANDIANGDFVPKWRYDNLADAARLDYDSPVKIRDLENKLEQERNDRCEEVADFQHESNAKIRDLENKLATIQRIADHG